MIVNVGTFDAFEKWLKVLMKLNWLNWDVRPSQIIELSRSDVMYHVDFSCKIISTNLSNYLHGFSVKESPRWQHCLYVVIMFITSQQCWYHSLAHKAQLLIVRSGFIFRQREIVVLCMQVTSQLSPRLSGDAVLINVSAFYLTYYTQSI